MWMIMHDGASSIKGGWLLLLGDAVDALAQQVRVAVVLGVFTDHVLMDPP
jgi:hypothetical protein